MLSDIDINDFYDQECAGSNTITITGFIFKGSDGYFIRTLLTLYEMNIDESVVGLAEVVGTRKGSVITPISIRKY